MTPTPGQVSLNRPPPKEFIVSKTHLSTFYVQLEPEFFSWTNSRGDRDIRRVKAVAITQTRPSKPRSGTVTVKLEVQSPDSFFHPLQPAAVIVLPDDLSVLTTPVYAQAIDEADAT